MKQKINSSITVKIAACIAAISIIFSSCLDNDKNYGTEVQVAGIALINAAPGSPNLDLIGDGQREILPQPFAYDSAIAYLPAYPGFRVFGFTLHNSYNLLASQQFYLHPGDAYSIFLADTLGNAKLFGFKDSLHLSDSSRIGIRFANMSPNSTSLDLYITDSTNSLVNNIAFGKASDFTNIATPVSGKISFQIKENGSNTVLATLPETEIKKGRIYTVWAKGFENATVDSLKAGLSIMRNK
ncbi:hypothetical protein A9P82_00155 [Arachidicoccus ginsenosidimutans]|uniref:DUF4397 domain-containing protein n=1 Tax=Arachidicoccus sp. BS20 TaxID=1850526 RepID=UPI0007F178A4|nr:DUF4397 domain-containing protein [Arachidicoccus sp. BS20]ANI87870.1 hypothetical protein A9P82_00155 [Arachidicoccus sp. BS20]